MIRQSCLFILFAVSIVVSQSGFTEGAPRVLIVVSSHGKDQGKTQPGFEFDEFSKAYLVFQRHGLAIDVSSPKGGKIEAERYNPNKPYNAQVLSDKKAMHKLNNSLPTKSLEAERYAAVFVVGGKGAMFDLPNDPYLKQTIATIYQKQGIVSAVCHGPAALVNVTLDDGTPLVNGRRVNGFTNQEEQLLGGEWLKTFDFLLEDKLKQLGGIFEQAPMMLSHVSVDGRLITGQNPFSTTATAEKLIEALGIELIPAAPYPEERTMALIASILDGDENAKKIFKESTELYQAPLIAMYGYYYLQQAKTTSETKKAVELMEIVAAQMQSEKLEIALATGYKNLGDNKKARQVIKKVLRNNPELDDAKRLLATLDGK